VVCDQRVPSVAYILKNNHTRFMSLDPRYYKNPETFDPSRFLGPNPESDSREWAFGFGRRACAGRFSRITCNP
jgi:cytochrome P450